MWHAKAKPFVESGEMAILGVVQEQHAERAQLYKQWKQYDFSIAQDASTQLNLAAVPIPILIDEHGVVRKLRARPGDLDKFIKQDFSAPSETAAASQSGGSEVAKLVMQANQILSSQTEPDVDKAIATFEQAVASEDKNGKALFGLGVAYRMRFDKSGNIDDFAKAAANWQAALAVNPNQYIWRRRIEQYGPRLTKPYPFYDWVETAQKEIVARGEEPVALKAKLTGTEVASPRQAANSAKDKPENPDPEAKILKDEKFLAVTATTVPAVTKSKKQMRVHLHCSIEGAKWNDEAPGMQVWIDDSSDGAPESRLLEYSVGNQKPGSTRTVDFEFQLADAKQPAKVRGFVLFHCCDDSDVCFYYRKDFELPVQPATN